MEQPVRDDQFYQFKSRSQRSIYQLFRDLLGQGPAALYRDACILAEPTTMLDSSVHLVGHLFRELEGQLRSLLVEPGQLGSLQEKKGDSVAKEAIKILKSAGVPDSDSLLKACENFVKTVARTTHTDEINNILHQLGIPLSHPVAESWRRLIRKEPLPKYAHHRVLGWIRPWDEDFERIVQEWHEVFLFILERSQERYVTYHKRLDELLKKEIPESEDIRQLRESVPNNSHAMQYFFDRLDKPGWLSRLNKARFFAGPSEPELESESGGRPFPLWPPGRYLIRMAELKSGDVMDIILAVDDRLNPYVLDDLIEATTKMPHKEAARIVPKVKGWLRLGRDRSFMPDCTVLVEFLARGGRVDESLDLARDLLSVSPFADKYSPSSLAVWDYDNVIEKIAPTLIDVCGLQALRLFCDLLDQALNHAWGNADKMEGHDDSYTWRIQIELTPDRGYYELDNAFVTAVRDCSVRLVQNDPSLLSSVMGELEGRRWLVFHRLALHLLCEFFQEGSGLAVQRLKQFRRYDNPYFVNEYYRLARISFRSLDPLEQDDIFNAIQKGPDIREVQRWRERNGQKITDEAVQLEIRKSVRNSLGELRPVLNDARASLLEELETELGEAEPLVKPYRNDFSWGSSEPEEASKFGSMVVQDVVAFLESWGPSDDAQHRSPDMVSRRLREAIVNDPERFAREALQFQKVDPTYVRHFFRGFEEALTAKDPQQFTWDNVISLCNWVASQDRDMPGRAVRAFSWDKNWANTRREIVDLVDTGLRESKGKIPFHLRHQVWDILEPLTTDPEPTTDYERQMVGERQEPLPLAGVGFREVGNHPGDVAVNTVRCLAIAAVVSYAFWIKRNLPRANGENEQRYLNLSTMPEVLKVLDHHLDKQRDDSIAVAYVYGKEFLGLRSLDHHWADNNKKRVFPSDESQMDKRAAAWEGYLLKRPAQQKCFDALRQEYEIAVEMVGKPTAETGHFLNPEVLLGEHLIQFYFQGKMEPDIRQSMLGKFWEKTTDEVRGLVLTTFGRNIFDQGTDLPGTVISRGQMLWDWRMSAIRAEDNPDSHRRELKAFGLWFASGKLDDMWALERLSEVLEMDDEIERAHKVVNQLANLADRFPGQVLDCVSRLVRGVRRPGSLHYWKKDLGKLLSTAEAVEDQAVRERCSTLKNILLSKGMTDYA